VRPQSKSTSSCELHETHSTGTTIASLSPSGGSPSSAVSATSSVPSPRTRHAHAPTPSGWLPLATPVDNAESCLPYTSGRSYLRPRRHDKLSRATVSCVRASARKSYGSLIARMTAHLARDRFHLMAHSRCANAKILLVHCLHLHLSRVAGHRYLVHATAVRLTRIGGAFRSHSVRGMPARVQLQAAAVVHDTSPMFQCPAHHSRLDVPILILITLTPYPSYLYTKLDQQL
jgi:hypothetical protein